jgi:hypothetical protein
MKRMGWMAWQNPNIVTELEVHQTDGTYDILLELVVESLHDPIAKTGMEEILHLASERRSCSPCCLSLSFPLSPDRCDCQGSILAKSESACP